MLCGFWESDKFRSAKIGIFRPMVGYTIQKGTILLVAIFIFSFLFRTAIVFHNPYPPSSDIGFHASIINLLLDQGKLPTWNSYHMGGEPLVTPPGFHFFVATLVLLTGMQVIFAELMVAAFYSSIIVFPAYLVSRKIWNNNSSGLIAAFFASISALSFEMIGWGGYTNIVALSLLILIFYLFFKDTSKPRFEHLLMGGLLFGGLLITHTFSLSVFVPILVVYFILLAIGKLVKLQDLKIKSTIRYFGVSIILGVASVSLWVNRVFSFYIGASSEGALYGGLDNKNMILANRTVETVVLSLVIVIIPTLFMLKASRKRYVDRKSLLLISWFLVPVIFTQAYLFGLYVDYSRFMYFIDFPGIIIISAGLLYLFRNIISVIKQSPKIKKTLPIMALITTLFVFIIVTPWSIFPDDAIKQADFYSTIHEPEALTLDWIKNITSKDSVLVADHLYGWWLSGIDERTTLSATSLEFLIYSHELEVAKAAQLLLDTDYYMDNGITQVREDGIYVVQHNPEFSIKKSNGESISIFDFEDSGTAIDYQYFDSQGQEFHTRTKLGEMKIIQPLKISRDENLANLTITYDDEFSTIKKTVTVYYGLRFAEVSYDIDVKFRVNLYNIWLPIFYRDGNITKYYEPDTMFGFYDPFEEVCGQVIFEVDVPQQMNLKTNPNRVEMLYNYPWKSNINIKILVGVFDVQGLSFPEEIDQRYIEIANSRENIVTFDPLFTWDYKEMINEYNVSYVICRDQTIYPKFAGDPTFRLLLNSGNVAVFQVTK